MRQCCNRNFFGDGSHVQALKHSKGYPWTIRTSERLFVRGADGRLIEADIQVDPERREAVIATCGGVGLTRRRMAQLIRETRAPASVASLARR